MTRKKQWSELSTSQKTVIIYLGILQVGLLAAALWDIRQRSADEINGSKAQT